MDVATIKSYIRDEVFQPFLRFWTFLRYLFALLAMDYDLAGFNPS
jgi:hypothetical protein